MNKKYNSVIDVCLDHLESVGYTEGIEQFAALLNVIKAAEHYWHVAKMAKSYNFWLDRGDDVFVAFDRAMNNIQ